MYKTIAALSLVTVLVAPRSAEAATASHHHISGVRFDVHADLGGYASVGAGFRADIPIMREGLLTNADDELAISLGVDAFFANFYHDYYDGGPYFAPVAVAQWNFYLGPEWSIFPEAGVAFYIGDEDYLPRGLPVYATLALGFGARYHFTERNALLMRVSRPAGLQVGVTF